VLAVSCGIVLLAVVGVLYMLGQVAPPEIPKIDEEHWSNVNVDADVAWYPGEFVPEDAQIGSGSIAPESVTDDDRKPEFYTFLIVGLDDGINTDTIMVASYDGVNKEANIISIPRDSLVNVSRSVKKINAAYPSGTLNDGGLAGGVAQLGREVKTIIGFVPDFYIIIEEEAFIRIIDAVGGVEVDAPFHMRYRDPIQNLHIDIPRGLQVLDGAQALNFARYRLGSSGSRTISDYQRIEHQQQVVKGVLERLLQPANLLNIPEFISIFSDNVHTDLGAGNILWLAGQLNSIRGTDALSAYTMPTTGTSGLPMYYELLDEAAIIELVNRTINPFTLDITADDVDILSRAP